MTTIEAQRADARDLKIEELKIKELKIKLSEVREELHETEEALSEARADLEIAEAHVVELEDEATVWTADMIPEMSGIRDDMRAGRVELAIDRLTRFLDRHGECWHAIAPISDPSALAFDWGQK